MEAQKQEVIIIIIRKAAVGQNDPKKNKITKTEKASRTLTLSTHIQSTHGDNMELNIWLL